MAMTSIHHPQLLHATHNFYTPPMTSTRHPRLLHTTYKVYTPPTTSTLYLRPVHSAYDLYTLPTTCTLCLRLVHGTYDLLHPPTAYYTTYYTHPQHTTCPHSVLHAPHPPTGREMNRNCLEIEGECHVTSRCYARRLLSDDSFADFAVDFVKIQGL